MTNLYDKKVKERIGLHYLLTKIQLYTLILLNIPQEVLNKIIDDQLLTAYLNKWATTWIDEQLTGELHKPVTKKLKKSSKI